MTLLTTPIFDLRSFDSAYDSDSVASEKNRTLFECQCIWRESTNWGHYFTSPAGDGREGPPFYVDIRATRRSSRLQCKGSTLFLNYFKTLSIGPAPGIEPRPPALQSSTLPTEPTLPRENRREKAFHCKNGNSSLNASFQFMYRIIIVTDLSQYLHTRREKLQSWLILHHIVIHCSTKLIKQRSTNVADNF